MLYIQKSTQIISVLLHGFSQSEHNHVTSTQIFPFKKQFLLHYQLFSILLIFTEKMHIRDVPYPYSPSGAASLCVQLQRMAAALPGAFL